MPYLQTLSSCTSAPPDVVVGAPIVSCYYGSGTEVMPDVYSTGVAGIGIRLHNASGQPMTNAAGVRCDTRSSNLGSLGANLKYAVSVSVEFVKTGPITPGNLDPRQTEFGFGVYNGSVNGALGGTGNNYVGFSGNVPPPRESTCNLNHPSVVHLPKISASSLAGGRARRRQHTVQHPAVAIVGMTLDAAAGTPVSPAGAGILGISDAGAGGMASGAGVQIVNSSGTAPVPPQVRNAMVSIAANVPATYRFGARYIGLGGTPLPGTVTSARVFTMDYQ